MIRKTLAKILAPLFVPAIVGFAFFKPIKETAVEVALLAGGREISGYLIDTSEDFDTDERGRIFWYYWGTYSFNDSVGNPIYGKISGSGRLNSRFDNSHTPIPIEIEFLPVVPAINQPENKASKLSIGSLCIKILLGLGLFGWWFWSFYLALLDAKNNLICKKPSIDA